MANIKPYYTTDDLIESIKTRIAFPLSQNTFTYNSVVSMMNEELQINAVPAIKQLHDEFFVYKCPPVPLVNGISRYPIPSRSMGMSVRDIDWSDASGNFFKLTRIAPEEKAFFQQNVGSNQAIGKYYIEGNEIVITPQVQTGATGSLNFFIYMRPNYLVRNNRAAFIQYFQNYSTISSVVPGDTFTIITGNQTPSPVTTTMFAVNNSAKTIVSISTSGVLTTVNPHGIPFSGNNKKSFNVKLTGTSNPNINNQLIGATAISATQIQLNTTIDVASTGGIYSIQNQFQIGSTDLLTAGNLSSAIKNLALESIVNASATDLGNSIRLTVSYEDISSTFQSSSSSISVDNTYIYIKFDDNFELTYKDPDTDITSDLYGPTNNILPKVDFLQTDPGHRTYTYDIKLREITSDHVGKFKVSDLKTYLNNSSGGVKLFCPIQVGDYICLANECIIPQIPPELHSALAERTAARILAAIGDKEGLAISQAKIAELDKQQATLIGQRVDSSVPKVFNQFSLLRLGKRGRRRL